MFISPSLSGIPPSEGMHELSEQAIQCDGGVLRDGTIRNVSKHHSAWLTNEIGNALGQVLRFQGLWNRPPFGSNFYFFYFFLDFLCLVLDCGLCSPSNILSHSRFILASHAKHSH